MILATWFSYHVVPFRLHTSSTSLPRRTTIPLFTNHNVTAFQTTWGHQERTPNPYQQSLYAYLPIPPLGKDMTQDQFLSGLNSEFSFSYTSCLTKAEEPSLPYYLPIAGGRIIGFILFPRVLVLCELQLAW